MSLCKSIASDDQLTVTTEGKSLFDSQLPKPIEINYIAFAVWDNADVEFYFDCASNPDNSVCNYASKVNHFDFFNIFISITLVNEVQILEFKPVCRNSRADTRKHVALAIGSHSNTGKTCISKR